MNRYVKLIGPAVAVMAVVACGGTPPAAANVASPVPSPRPSVSSTTEPAQTIPPSFVQMATSFLMPFVYSLPIDPTFDEGAMTEQYFELRVPEWAERGQPGGLLVQAIGGGRVDPCDAASAPLALERGPGAVFDYLETIPRLTITDAVATTVGERPAREATVTAVESDECPSLHVWAAEGEPFITGTSLRLIAVDVDGHHIVLTTYGEAYVPEWPALAEYIIGSIDWGYRIPSPTPPS